MAYVVSVTKFVKDSGVNVGKRRVALTYTSPGRVFVEELDAGGLDDIGLKDHAAKRVVSLEAEDTAFTGITEGNLIPELKPPPVIDPAEEAERVYQLALAELTRLQGLVDLKVLAADDQLVLDAINDLKGKTV